MSSNSVPRPDGPPCALFGFEKVTECKNSWKFCRTSSVSEEGIANAAVANAAAGKTLSAVRERLAEEMMDDVNEKEKEVDNEEGEKNGKEEEEGEEVDEKMPVPQVTNINIILQGDHGGQGLGFVDFARVFHSLPNFAWAGENWAEMAEHLGKTE